MASISRRTFLKRGGTGIAAAGVCGASVLSGTGPGFSSTGSGSRRRRRRTRRRAATGPLVVHIPDPRRR